MFCPYCGTESTQGLKYCNRCGGNLGALTGAQGSRPAVQAGTAWAVGTTTALLGILGLGLTVALATELSHTSIPPGTLLTIVASVAATALGSVYLVTRFWMWLLGGARVAAVAGEEPRPGVRPSHTSELDPSRQRALADKPFPSITEQTTRTLDPAQKKY